MRVRDLRQRTPGRLSLPARLFIGVLWAILTLVSTATSAAPPSAGIKRYGPQPGDLFRAVSSKRNEEATNDIAARGPLKVLFIGNSYTYFNNLPRLLEQLSASAGTPMETRMVTEGGASLQDHWEKGDALRTLRQSSWDYVILQDQSTLGVHLINGQSNVADPEYFYKYARLFDQEIKKTGARTVFFLTWASEHSVARDQAALTYAYMSIARELKDLIAPVGIVWEKLGRQRPDLELYEEDNSHPRSTGSYLAACVLYATIYGKSPLGLTGKVSGPSVDEDGNVDISKNVTLADLHAEDAKQIQRAAWVTYRQMKASNGYVSVPKPPSVNAPSLPRGRRPTPQDLAGLWEGSLKFYPVPWLARIELKLDLVGGNWKAVMKIKFEGHPDSDKEPQITNFKITDRGISFVDLKGASGVPMKYSASFTGQSLSGVVEAKADDRPIYAIGTWKLTRQN